MKRNYRPLALLFLVSCVCASGWGCKNLKEPVNCEHLAKTNASDSPRWVRAYFEKQLLVADVARKDKAVRAYPRKSVVGIVKKLFSTHKSASTIYPWKSTTSWDARFRPAWREVANAGDRVKLPVSLMAGHAHPVMEVVYTYVQWPTKKCTKVTRVFVQICPDTTSHHNTIRASRAYYQVFAFPTQINDPIEEAKRLPKLPKMQKLRGVRLPVALAPRFWQRLAPFPKGHTERNPLAAR